MPDQVINQLTNLDTQKVSLVTRGAVQRTFALTKSENTMAMDAKYLELLGEVMKADGGEGEAAFIAEVQKANPGLEGKELAAIVAAQRILSGFSDNAAVKKTAEGLTALAKGEMPPWLKPDKEKEKKECEPDEEVEMKKGLPADVVKALEPLTKEQRVATLKALRQGQETAEKERIAKAEERIAKAEREAAEAKAESAKQTAILKAEQDKARTREFIAKAEKELPHLPGKPEDLGAVLKRLADLDPKLFEQVEGVFKAAEGALAESGLFVEKGKGSGSGEESALDAIAKARDEILKKQEQASA